VTAQETLLKSPWRVVVAAVAVVVTFALVYPLAGGIATTGGEATIHYDATYYLQNLTTFRLVFLRSLLVSIGAFTLVGTPGYVPLGYGRFLYGLESLFGMAFVALLTASLVRDS
jgi:hypothetical protein